MKKNFLLLVTVFSFSCVIGFAQCPNAGFTAIEYASTCPPLFDSLINSSTNVLAGASFDYYFGDGQNSSLPDPAHVYSYNGTFYPTLIVTNPGGCADTFISPDPVIVDGPEIQSETVTPVIGNIPLAVNFQLVSNSVSFVWDFGDGSPLQYDSLSVTHLYSTPGIYHPKVLITDGIGCMYFFILDSVNACICPQLPYQHFPDSAAKWSESIFGMYSNGGNYYTTSWGWFYASANDTLIFPYQYHLLGFQRTFSYTLTNGWCSQANNSPIQIPGQIIGASREDSSRKVWVRFFNDSSWAEDWSSVPHILNTDFLVYDFNINAGDTLNWKVNNQACLSVDSIVLTGGIVRKKFNFSNSDFWIEGIGSCFGFFGPYEYQSQHLHGLKCFTQNNIIVYPDNLNGSCDSTTYYPVGIDEIKDDNNSLHIYPNPAQNTINISSPNLEGNYSLKIYNLLGQVVKQSGLSFSTAENKTIDVSQLPSGCYELMLINRSSIVSKRFVKE